MPEENGDYVNLVGASELAGVGSTAIRYWILTGKLKAEKVGGGRWRIQKEDVRAADEAARQSSRRGKRGPRGRLIRAVPGGPAEQTT